MQLCDYSAAELIRELEQRGFMILTQEEVEEVNDDIEGGNLIVSLVEALHSSINLGDIELQVKLIEAIVFAATGEHLEPEDEEAVA